MRTSDFRFDLPRGLIAQRPAAERGGARLLHLGSAGTVAHRRFAELAGLLGAGDLLVRNITRVIPARILARREAHGGRVELLVLPGPEEREDECGSFEALTRPALPPGTRLRAGDARLEAGPPVGGGRRRVRILEGAASALDLAERLGRTPLPPYIRRGSPDGADRERYQTVYARVPGSVAAPTAGLHFDEAMFRRLRKRGVAVADLTLHIGHGTFAPVRVEDPREHDLGAERFRLPEATGQAVRAALAAGRRVIALGTTTVRVLETPGVLDEAPAAGETSLLILPGHRFRVISAMVTNFHLPGSSLLMLVAALGGTGPVLAAYREAVRERYRFHSYGDAMFVEKRAATARRP